MVLTSQDRLIPEWWSDVEYSLCLALSQYAECLSLIERQLAESSKNARYSMSNNLPALLAKRCQRISQIMRIAEARNHDARFNGMTPMSFGAHRIEAAKLSCRAKALGVRFALQMKNLQEELSRQSALRRDNRIYQVATPSYINIRL